MPAQHNVRQIALQAALLADSGLHVQAALERCASSLPQRERHFCGDLVCGYLRQRPRLEFILGIFLKKPQKLPRPMLLIMAMALYSLLFQNAVPAYAAIDEAVRLVKKTFGSPLGRVANGALRAMARELDALSDPDWHMRMAADPWAGLALYWGMPLPIANLWRQSYGREQALMLMRRSAARPWTGIRPNPRFAGYPELVARLEKAAGSEKAGSRGFAFPPGQLPEFLQAGGKLHALGAFSFQAAGSMLVLERLGLTAWRESLWDCCAGHGGKSAALLEQNVPVLLASDINMRRLAALGADCRRLGLAAPAIFLADASRPPISLWPGDILADAPCSGLGVLARRPDIRGNFRFGELAKLADLQGKLLRSLQALLLPGRKLAYVTCTLNPAENQDNLQKLLAACPSMQLEAQWQTPHDHPWLEGMFGAVLSKKSC